MSANTVSAQSKNEDEDSDAEDELVKNQMPENRLWQKVSSRYNARTISAEHIRTSLQINSEGLDSALEIINNLDHRSHSRQWRSDEEVDEVCSKSVSSNILSSASGSSKDQTEITEDLTPLEHLLSNMNMNRKFVYQDKTNKIDCNKNSDERCNDSVRKNEARTIVLKKISRHFVIGLIVKSFINKLLSKSRRAGKTFRGPTNSEDSISLSLYSDYSPLRIHEVTSNRDIAKLNATETQQNNSPFSNSVFLNYTAKLESRKSLEKRKLKEKEAREKKEKKEKEKKEKKAEKARKKREKKENKDMGKKEKLEQKQKDKKEKKGMKIKYGKGTTSCNKACVHKSGAPRGPRSKPVSCRCDNLPILEDYKAKKGTNPKIAPSIEPYKPPSVNRHAKNYLSYSRKRNKPQRRCCADPEPGDKKKESQASEGSTVDKGAEKGKKKKEKKKKGKKKKEKKKKEKKKKEKKEKEGGSRRRCTIL